jgi:hypothetical protein
MIYLEPTGGLGNRMRAIASCIWLSKQQNQNLKVIWKESHELIAPYQMLFRPTSEFAIIESNDTDSNPKASDQPNLLKSLLAAGYNKWLSYDYCFKDPFIKDNEVRILDKTKGEQHVYFKTCEQFGEHQDFYKVFHPIKSLEERILKLTDPHKGNLIGVHVRRTDHALSHQSSPLSLFIDKIQEEIDLNPNIKFFLSTDDEGVQRELSEKFESRMIYVPNKKNRQAPQGIQDAVVDMFCLANCDKIYGSFFSSFSIVASKLKNVELEILQSNIDLR